jgi:hypothetical protein
MKRAFWSLTLLVSSVYGQTVPNEFVTRIVSDLVPLRNEPPSSNPARLAGLRELTRADLAALRSFLAEKAPGQTQVINRLAEDINGHYGGPLIPWETPYALTTALAGRELPNDRLTFLANALASAMDSAVDCRKRLSSLRRSMRFKSALELAYRELLELGVGIADAKTVVESLSVAGLRIADPNPAGSIIRPIRPR